MFEPENGILELKKKRTQRRKMEGYEENLKITEMSSRRDVE